MQRLIGIPHCICIIGGCTANNKSELLSSNAMHAETQRPCEHAPRILSHLIHHARSCLQCNRHHHNTDPHSFNHPFHLNHQHNRKTYHHHRSKNSRINSSNPSRRVQLIMAQTRRHARSTRKSSRSATSSIIRPAHAPITIGVNGRRIIRRDDSGRKNMTGGYRGCCSSRGLRCWGLCAGGSWGTSRGRRVGDGELGGVVRFANFLDQSSAAKKELDHVPRNR